MSAASDYFRRRAIERATRFADDVEVRTLPQAIELLDAWIEEAAYWRARFEDLERQA